MHICTLYRLLSTDSRIALCSEKISQVHFTWFETIATKKLFTHEGVKCKYCSAHTDTHSVQISTNTQQAHGKVKSKEKKSIFIRWHKTTV